MSGLSRTPLAGAEANVLSDIERAILAGAALALRTRAAAQRQRAADGTSTAGESHPHVVIQTGEAAITARLADAFEALAAVIEAEMVR